MGRYVQNLKKEDEFMAIFYGLNSDNCSSLFGSFSSSKNLGLYGSLGDLGLIQKGGYKKLCKAYYAKEKESLSDSIDSANSNKKEETKDSITADSAVALKKSVNNLSKLDYTKDNVSKIQNGVKDFVKTYNSMIDTAEGSKSDNVARITKNLTNYTKINEKVLKSVGITIGSDNKLSVSEETLGKASVSELKDLFRGSSSFAGRASSYATSLYTTAVANNSSLYSGKGNLKALSMSSLFDTYL